MAELAAGDDVRIAVVSPWMLKNDKLQQLVASRKVRGLIRWFWIDEIHLANKSDPTVWREAYTAIIFMRPRLSSQTIWAGFTGTVTLTETRLISQTLGFRPGYFMDARYSLDRPHVKIIPRFMEHSVSGHIFLDLSFLVPLSLSSAADIPSTLVFCQTIELGHRIGAFLDTLLPATLEGRELVVMPCNALLDADYREKFKARLETGITRIGVVTDTCTYGLNVHATRVIIVLPSDLGGYSRLVQQAGRVARDGAHGLVYVLAPAWTRDVPESEIKTKTDRENQARRARAPKVIIGLLNATSAYCPRQIHSGHYDESFVQPSPCCSLHDPEPELSADAALVFSWQQRIQPKPAPKKYAPRTDGTHLVPTSRMKASVSRLLDHWKIKHWPKYRPPCTDETSAVFLPTSLITRLAEKLHLCTTMERFGTVVGSWEYLDQAGDKLFDYLQELLRAFDEVYVDTEPEAGTSVDDDIEEIPPPPVGTPLHVLVIFGSKSGSFRATSRALPSCAWSSSQSWSPQTIQLSSYERRVKQTRRKTVCVFGVCEYTDH